MIHNAFAKFAGGNNLDVTTVGGGSSERQWNWHNGPVNMPFESPLMLMAMFSR